MERKRDRKTQKEKKKRRGAPTKETKTDMERRDGQKKGENTQTDRVVQRKRETERVKFRKDTHRDGQRERKEKDAWEQLSTSNRGVIV